MRSNRCGAPRPSSRENTQREIARAKRTRSGAKGTRQNASALFYSSGGHERGVDRFSDQSFKLAMLHWLCDPTERVEIQGTVPGPAGQSRSRRNRHYQAWETGGPPDARELQL